MYNYNAYVIKIIDGDTVDLEVDLGFEIRFVRRFRLLGINAPEMKGESKVAGQAAKDALINKIPLGSLVNIDSFKDGADKYGRYLCTINVTNPDKTITNVNKWMVEQGFAVVYMES